MAKDSVKEKIMVPALSKVKVSWWDTPINYSKEGRNKVKNYFASKYGLNKQNINVVYRPIKMDDKGNMVELTGLGIESIMNSTYQRALMKEIIEREKKAVDFNRIIALDEKVNAELNVDLTQSQHVSWTLKWLRIDNFLSFGDDNYFPITKLNGLTIINSIPSNRGGKTTLSIDAVKFLLHGNTTKTDKNEQIFNLYSNKDVLVVRGMIDIEGDEFIIERRMKRSAKKGGGWNVTNTVNYYNLLPDGTEEQQNEEDAKVTTKKIKESVGSEKDFELLVLATESNLDNLIGLSTTDSGKILTRLIGLEILELKEAVVRTMYNDFNRKKKSNDFDVITLGNEITEHKEKVTNGLEIEKLLKDNFEKIKGEIVKLNLENDTLLNSKQKLDVTIEALNPADLENEIQVLTKNGTTLKEKINKLTKDIADMGVIVFDEDKLYQLNKELTSNITEEAVKSAELLRLQNVITELINGGICKSCHRKLDNVDNSAHIKEHEKQCEKLTTEIAKLITHREKVLEVEIKKLNDVKKLIDVKNQLELDKDRAEVEIVRLRNNVSSKMTDLKKYNLNLDSIEFNKNVDSKVSIVKTNLAVQEFSKDETLIKIQKIENEIKQNRTDIETKTKLIETIKKEDEIEKIYKVYIELVGKKGISKLVLRSVLPIINAEVQRLLEDSFNFEIEIFIDDKNDVQFLIKDDDVSRPLKSGSGLEKTASSIALRSILGKMSTLPMPNFISFDEVLGKVSAENIDKLKPLFDKIKDMYDVVFLITHNDLVKDWGDNVVTVVKDKHISKINIK